MSTRCDSCAVEVRFVDENGDCPECAKGSPQERAAIALYRNFAEGMERSPVPWDSPRLDHTTLRQIFRRKARLALTAAIDVDELADVIATYKEDPDGNLLPQTRHEIAHTVAVHYLGSEALE